MKTLGFQVTATDAIGELVEAARLADSAENCAVADAKNLPFSDGQFDLIVAYNVLMDVENVPVAVPEIRRVQRALVSSANPSVATGSTPHVDACPAPA